MGITDSVGQDVFPGDYIAVATSNRGIVIGKVSSVRAGQNNSSSSIKFLRFEVVYVNSIPINVVLMERTTHPGKFVRVEPSPQITRLFDKYEKVQFSADEITWVARWVENGEFVIGSN